MVPRHLLLALAIVVSGCSDDNPAGPTSSSTAPIRITLTDAVGGRGLGLVYHYQFDWTASSATTDGVLTHRPVEFTLFGPEGEVLIQRAFTSDETPPHREYALGSSNNVWFTHTDASHPYAERIRIRFRYQRGTSTGTLELEYPVRHADQGPRLHEFTVEPTNPYVGDPVTIRWNVQGADRVRLESPIPRSGTNNGESWSEEVEPQGTRTLVARLGGLVSVNLFINGVRARSLQVYMQARPDSPPSAADLLGTWAGFLGGWGMPESSLMEMMLSPQGGSVVGTWHAPIQGWSGSITMAVNAERRLTGSMTIVAGGNGSQVSCNASAPMMGLLTSSGISMHGDVWFEGCGNIPSLGWVIDKGCRAGRRPDGRWGQICSPYSLATAFSRRH